MSRYSNHLTRGDYNTEVPIFKMAAARFVDVLMFLKKKKVK